MTSGIICAGGKGSRLGPLAAQISKALISVGQRPHLAHQIDLLHKNGVSQIVVVTSESTDLQIKQMLVRSGLAQDGTITTEIQKESLGPVDAIRVGLERVPINEPVVILMADTYIDEQLPEGTWIGVSKAKYTRSFCFESSTPGIFVDGTASAGKMITMGAYRFESALAAYSMAATTVRNNRRTGEVTMAPFLTAMSHAVGHETHEFNTWMDLGDVKALAEARQTKFIARGHHWLEVDNYGLLTKHGSGRGFLKQGTWMHDIAQDEDPRVSNLVPHVYSFSGAGTAYTMEYVDLPTLAELWLYWPGRPDTWADIIQNVMDRLDPLWEPTKDQGWLAEFSLYFDKACERLTDFDKQHGSEFADSLFDRMMATRELFEEDDSHEWVRAHGDLTFNNIMFSLNTGAVKLIDPRGDESLPMSYELAKLRHSYRGLSAITHGLFDQYGNLLPWRGNEIGAMDDVIAKYGNLNKLQACEALLLLGSSPLHSTDEGLAMIKHATLLLDTLFED